MPRRYPRLYAKDKEGHTVSIPLSIAPRLLANEEFVSLSQEKVDAIAEANERVRSQDAATLSPKPSSVPIAVNESAYKADDESSLHQNVGSSITGTASPMRSSASSSQDAVRNVSTKPARGKKRVRRLWTSEEDQVVLCAVLRNESGASLIGRLPNRSRSAVLKRFYILREKWKNDRRRRGRDDRLNSGSELDMAEGIGETRNAGMGNEDGDAMEEEKVDKELIGVESDNAIEADEDGNAEDGKVGDDAVSLDEYESYDENMDGEADEDIDEDGGVEKVTSDVEDGYRSDEEMDEIPPLE